ncbi:CPBP family intramembrane metalloprotease [Duganella sp. FT109W]|uniref:CPBP family intramembrane metalloprotease n=1 Tax=Duganella margarita TaxID=2692170 RepID=A0ABW9WI26_9BURK|nr:CPBP family intramembrane glutamic endopeptidase [Duganella margarita]MYN40814.1 CPBP family intramembrane metalloprotease [Duganella margarita]
MPIPTLLTFLLLAAAIGTVWSHPLLPPLLFAAAVGAGLLAGVLHAPALIALILFAGAAWLAGHARAAPLRAAALTVTILLALALAMHKLPGFNNPLLIDHVQLSANAVPFTQYANFDKGAVGLILLAWLCQRVSSWSELGTVLRRTLPVLVLTVVATLGFALAAGVVGVDLKLPQQTLSFIAVNLLFTVVAEEAFFRGLLQARLATALQRFRWGPWLAVAVSALLFGAAHLGGGLRYGILAGIAGIGYAWAYQRTQRIEAALLVHIALNAVHFIGFTYPARIDGV